MQFREVEQQQQQWKYLLSYYCCQLHALYIPGNHPRGWQGQGYPKMQKNASIFGFYFWIILSMNQKQLETLCHPLEIAEAGFLQYPLCDTHFAIKRSHLTNQLSTGGDENTIVNQVLQGHTSNSNCKRTPLVLLSLVFHVAFLQIEGSLFWISPPHKIAAS